ncbi:MAG: THUMP domain-containing protein [Candidatus Bathyarchaeia archaeon]
MYEFNILVSCSWSAYRKAREEILKILKLLGDEKASVKPTLAQGIIGVKTSLDSRQVVRELQRLFDDGQFVFEYTLKWVPVDLWTFSNLESMKKAVAELRDKIQPGERWRITLEKRRYTLYHKIDIIRELAKLIDEKVDLEKPDKILRVDIIGKYAGVSVLSPRDVFSTTKMAFVEEG